MPALTKIALGGLLVCAAAGCRSDAMAVEAEDVRVEAGPSHLVVTNGRDERIYYFAYWENPAVQIDWVPCTTSNCASVAAQSIERVPYSEVAGSGEGDTILFYWWIATVTEQQSPGVGQIHMLRVER